MSPRPDDDLFIEPPDDEGVVFGDYNSTWLKNQALVEKSRRIKIKTKENSSRLVIQHLDVLDSGYYQCVVSNSAASVNTTSVLRVINVPGKDLKNRKQHASPEEYDEYEAMERGRLPHEEDADLYSVPDGAAGPGYAPIMPASRWLDRIKMQTGECIAYRGDACRNFLAGRHVMITSENREDMYDIDRNLRAAMLFIGQMPAVSAECKQYSQAVACYHMYKVCEEKVGPRTQRICRNDCERIQKDICPNEYAMASQHELVGDGPKALLPSCASLPLSTQAANCISVIDSPKMTSIGPPAPPPGQPASSSHCYTDNGKNYEGTVSTTESGYQCMTWAESQMSREFTVRNYPQLKTAKNHCRNPGGKRTKPWCFSRPHGREEYCEISQCSIDQTHRAVDGPRSNATSPSNLSEMWWSLPANLQLGVLAGGFVALALLLFIICCACCCKNKKKSSKQRGQQPVPHFSVTSAPTSVVASGTNSGYCRKLQMNGTSTPILGRTAPMEMAALLPQQHNNNIGTGPPSYADSYRTMPHHDEPYHILEIPARDLAVGDQIGIGQFGIVFAAQWHTNVSHEPLTVAVKTTRPDAPIQEIKQMEDEVRRVAAFDHLHVVRLLGVSYLDAGRLSAVFEYMIYGNVHDLISVKSSGSEAEKRADHDEFIRIATQIAHGMEYLISHRFIHRDLAARNCLVGENRVIKVMTFGMMRSAYEEDYYPMMHRGRLPIRWMSREALEGQRYGEPSDVWAFGVTLWEMFSYGRTPYEGLSDQQVIGAISTRQLLECPPMCPPNIYSLMVECWTENPERRPTFAEIRPRLEAWTMNSPAHSLLQHRAPSASTNSGSSGAAPRGGGSFGNVGVGNNRSHPPFHSSTGLRSRRPGDEGSPLVRRDGAYNYSDDDDDEAVESD